VAGATWLGDEGGFYRVNQLRDALAAQIKAALTGAAFNGQVITDQQGSNLIAQAQSLIDQAAAL